jgi:dihydrodipicolinate synthase/N-acetylneuraminate lyase
MLLEGLHIPLTTPFHPDGRLHTHKLAANVVRYSKSPAAGLIALAPWAGEPTLVTDDEAREVLRTVGEAAAIEKVLLANVSRDSVRGTLALAEAAAASGFDGVLVGLPAMLGAEQERELMTYFEAVADRSPLPVVLASLARNNGRIATARIAELALHANVAGLYLDEMVLPGQDGANLDTLKILESAGGGRRTVTVTQVFGAVTRRMQLQAARANDVPDGSLISAAALVSAAALARNPAAAATAVVVERPAPALKTRTKQVGFQIVVAEPTTMLAQLEAGAVGIAPAFAACSPQATYEVYAAWKDGDPALAAEKQQRAGEAAEFAETLGPAALKFGCDLNGYCGGAPRLPHLPLSGTDRARLRALMSGMRC